MNEQIEQLESQLQEMGRSKRLAVYAILFFSAIYMSWVLYGEALSDEMTSVEDQIISLEMKLMKNSNRSLQAAIQKTQKESLAIEDQITHLHFQKQFLQTKLHEIDFIYYSEQGAAEILDAILKHSVEKQINLEYIQKAPLAQTSERMLSPQSRLVVSGTGRLAAITALHHYVESLNALLVSESLHVTIDDTNATHFELTLLHYGVKP